VRQIIWDDDDMVRWFFLLNLPSHHLFLSLTWELKRMILKYEMIIFPLIDNKSQNYMKRDEMGYGGRWWWNEIWYDQPSHNLPSSLWPFFELVDHISFSYVLIGCWPPSTRYSCCDGGRWWDGRWGGRW